MRHLLLFGALVCAAACGQRESWVDLPARTTTVASEPAGPDSITITLTASGRVFAAGRAMTLSELDAWLDRMIRFDSRWFAATTVARLGIDRAAPWAHVEWIVSVLAGKQVAEARILYAGAELPCRIHPDGIHYDYFEVPDERVLRIKVSVDERGRVRCGALHGERAAAVAQWLAAAQARVERESLAGICAEILAQPRSPWGALAEVYERMRAAGVRTLSFPDFVAPTADAVTRDRLPAPPAGPEAEAGGMEVDLYWPVGAHFAARVDDSELEEEPEPEVPSDLEEDD